MARLPALAAALSPLDVRPESLLYAFARQLRDDGLIVSTGRGTAASDMTFRDAATFLLGICGAATPAGATEAVLRLRELSLFSPDKVDRSMVADLPEPLNFIPKAQTFGRVVEHLIEEAPIFRAWEEAYLRKPVYREVGAEATEYVLGRSIEKVRDRPATLQMGFARALRVICYAPGLAAEMSFGWPWRQYEDADAIHLHYGQAIAMKGYSPLATLIGIEVGVPQLLALHEAVATPSIRPKRPRKTERG